MSKCFFLQILDYGFVRIYIIYCKIIINVFFLKGVKGQFIFFIKKFIFGKMNGLNILVDLFKGYNLKKIKSISVFIL